MEALISDAYSPMTDAWEAAKKRCADGGGTDKERLAVESEKRLKLIFGILSGDMIEELGSFNASGDDPLRELSVRIARKDGHGRRDDPQLSQFMEGQKLFDGCGIRRPDTLGMGAEPGWRNSLLIQVCI